MAHDNLADALPDVTRHDVAVIAVSQQDLTSTDEQRASADAIMEWWALAPWPQHLVSVSCFVSTKHVAEIGLLRGARVERNLRSEERLRVLTYEQWSNEQAYRSFRRSDQTIRTSQNTDVAEFPAPGEYQLYRSHHNTVRHDTTPGRRCIVFVTIEFESSDAQRQLQWVDSVLDAINAEPKPIPGMVAAYFHTSMDGTRVINYAEWTSEQAYDEALATGPDGVGQTDLPEWHRVRDLPGVTNNTVARYTLYRSLHPLVEANDC